MAQAQNSLYFTSFQQLLYCQHKLKQHYCGSVVATKTQQIEPSGV